jgi:hypothetical protein
MWSKRLEKKVFKWPKVTQSAISLSKQQLNSLLGGFDIHDHQPLFYASDGHEYSIVSKERRSRFSQCKNNHLGMYYGKTHAIKTKTD